MKFNRLLCLFTIIYFCSQLIITEVCANEQRFYFKTVSGAPVLVCDIPVKHFIYGNNPGQSGLPTKIELAGSRNLKNYELSWPVPQRKISDTGHEIFFYEKHLEIPLNITPLDGTQNVFLEFDIEYVLCSDWCELAREHIAFAVDHESFASPALNRSNSLTDIFSKLISFGQLACLGVLGGFILNFMPCVLPVLSLKILGFAKHNMGMAGRKKALICTIAGIVSSFWCMAFIAITFKAAGKYFGLGMGFQEPNFIIAVILIITFFISISLERIHLRLPEWITTRTKVAQGVAEYYFGGILATVLSTPCTAPFLGSALFLSLEQKGVIIFLIFSSIAFGFSLPYIALLIWPRVLNFLPRSGKWLIKIRLCLIFLLVCTVFWLLSVLASQIGLRAVIGLFLLLLLIKFVLENNYFLFRKSIIRLSILSCLVYISFLLPEYSHREDQVKQQINNKLWQKFEPDKIENLIASGKTVFVDITADWCVTCQYNKYFVLDTPEVMHLLSRGNIVAMRGDFTNRDEVMYRFLKQRKISGIPYNAVFTHKMPQGQDLPVILSIRDIKNALQP